MWGADGPATVARPQEHTGILVQLYLQHDVYRGLGHTADIQMLGDVVRLPKHCQPVFNLRELYPLVCISAEVHAWKSVKLCTHLSIHGGI